MPTKHPIFLPAIFGLLMLPLVAVGNPATAVTSGGRLQLAQARTFPAVKLARLRHPLGFALERFRGRSLDPPH